MKRLGVIPVLGLAGLVSVFLVAIASAQSTATIEIVAIDADISGNGATTLGPLNACVRTEPGSSVTVDMVVDAVPEDRGIIGFQFTLLYDPAVLSLRAVDSEFLLAANGSYEPFEGIADPLPDSDGTYTYIVADLASNPPSENIESGAGVLARLTFNAVAAGISNVAPSFNPPDEYPSIIDNRNETIGVDSTGTARIAVGQPCDIPPEATPIIETLPPIDEIPGIATPVPTGPPDGGTPGPTETGGTGESSSPTPTRSGEASPTEDGDNPSVDETDEEDGGTSAGTIAAVAALAAAGLALAGAGAWLLLRRRGAGGPPAP